jgi:putative protein-disulfide isomerase
VVSTPTLHYLYDPLCGWCYGAAPLVAAARDIMTVRPHGGGMMTGANRQTVTPALRQYVMRHDQRIAALTGQPFGEAYFDGLLRDAEAVFDSTPPTAAMLAAESMAGRGLDMIARLQIAHYVDGRRIAEPAALRSEAQTIGLDPAAFAVALDKHLGESVQRHISQTRLFMNKLGAEGFPSFVLETAGSYRLIDIAPYLDDPAAWQAWLRDAGDASPTGHAPNQAGCRIDRRSCGTGEP